MANRRTRIVNPIFKGFEVRVILARDIYKTGRRLGADLSGAEAAFVTCASKPGTGWLVFGLDPSPGVIAHEASHAVRAVFAHAGAKHDEESFAYHLEHLVSAIHKFLKR